MSHSTHPTTNNPQPKHNGKPWSKNRPHKSARHKPPFVMPDSLEEALVIRDEHRQAIQDITERLKQGTRDKFWTDKATKAREYKTAQLAQIEELIREYGHTDDDPRAVAIEETGKLVQTDNPEPSPEPALPSAEEYQSPYYDKHVPPLRPHRTRTAPEKLHFELLCGSLMLFRVLREEGTLTSAEAAFVAQIEVAIGHHVPIVAATDDEEPESLVPEVQPTRENPVDESPEVLQDSATTIPEQPAQIKEDSASMA